VRNYGDDHHQRTTSRRATTASKQIASKGTAVMAYTRFTPDSSTPSLWRVTFNHPPINLIDSVMIGELGQLFAAIERNEGPAVLLFDSADPDYFLAHYDIAAANSSLVNFGGRAERTFWKVQSRISSPGMPYDSLRQCQI
jgi:enoyl-CoA hydratase/carnithine racemase